MRQRRRKVPSSRVRGPPRVCVRACVRACVCVCVSAAAGRRIVAFLPCVHPVNIAVRSILGMCPDWGGGGVSYIASIHMHKGARGERTVRNLKKTGHGIYMKTGWGNRPNK